MRWLSLLLCLPCLFADPAAAHGPLAPIASDYLARLVEVPPGLRAQVVDGDQRMWLQDPTGAEVEVLDYVGAPYLRFSRVGVEVNTKSEMYFLNQTPFPLPVPRNLSRRTPARWVRVSGERAYGWHDGRLHALAGVSVPPGVAYVGRWTIPLLIGGRQTALAGALYHARHPPLVWFWPIIVLVLCYLAGWRLRERRVNSLLASAAALLALAATAAAVSAHYLHGRPGISVLQWLEWGACMAFVGWALSRLARGRSGTATRLLIAFVAIWQALDLVPTLTHGFVLGALPAFLTRASVVLCFACGAVLLLPDSTDPPTATSRRVRRGGVAAVS